MSMLKMLLIILIIIAVAFAPKERTGGMACHTLSLSIKSFPLEQVEEINHVHAALSKYNRNVSLSTSAKIAEVAHAYSLTEKYQMEWFIGQILLESGAQQYWGPYYPNEGELVESYAGAVGICQIMPRTGLYMLQTMSDDERNMFIVLGAQDFSGVETIDDSKKWLSNETNNIIMWGYIMRNELNRRPIQYAMISYNAGVRGMMRYLKAGNSSYNHPYIRGIKRKLKSVDLSV